MSGNGGNGRREGGEREGGRTRGRRGPVLLLPSLSSGYRSFAVPFSSYQSAQRAEHGRTHRRTDEWMTARLRGSPAGGMCSPESRAYTDVRLTVLRSEHD